MKVTIIQNNKNALIAVTGSIALGYLVYKAIRSFGVGGQGHTKIRKVRGKVNRKLPFRFKEKIISRHNAFTFHVLWRVS